MLQPWQLHRASALESQSFVFALLAKILKNSFCVGPLLQGEGQFWLVAALAWWRQWLVSMLSRSSLEAFQMQSRSFPDAVRMQSGSFLDAIWKFSGCSLEAGSSGMGHKVQWHPHVQR